MAAGQGRRCAFATRRGRSPSGRFRWSVYCGVALAVAVAFASGQAFAQLTDLRLRIAWGGGDPRRWSGEIKVDGGELIDWTPLGLAPDAPGAQFRTPSGLGLEQRSPTTYDACEIVVRSDLSTRLRIVIAPQDDPTSVRPHDILLQDLLADFRELPLDDRRNRVLVRRAPQDELRVILHRANMIYAPGEEMEFSLHPHWAGLPAGASLVCRVSLMDPAGDEVHGQDHQLQTDEQGNAPPLENLKVTLPSSEGVYDLTVTISPKRLAPSLVRARPLLTRRVQVVVIGETTVALPQDRESEAEDKTNPWKELISIDPSHPLWWERLRALPQLKRWPARMQQPLGNGKPRKTEIAGESFVELGPGQWQAYPLPVNRVGQPHLLEISLPPGRRQLIGISILEPDAAGQIPQINLDSGVDTASSQFLEAPAAPGLHRLVFWPRTRSPLVLLANRHASEAASYGEVRLLDGPSRLPTPSAELAETAAEPPRNNRRLAALYLDKPLFPENFGAADALDEETGRALKDWNTFYVGARRLAEYLKFAGYGGAVISVVCEGSALYPSRLLEPTPKYENGLFFGTGQDPIRKDVLELLLRVFDQEGLTLIPSVQLATPIPALEQIRRRGESAGLEPVGEKGRSWMTDMGGGDPLGFYYNPLDSRVQQAILAVVDELAARCEDHPSFGGIAIQLGRDSLTMPGEAWGLDDRTMALFARETGASPPMQGPDRHQARAKYVGGEGRGQWLSWRAHRLAFFRRRLLEAVQSRRAEAKLILAGVHLFSVPEAASRLRPKLPHVDDFQPALLSLGIDLQLDEAIDGMVWLRPQRTSPPTASGKPGAAEAAYLQANVSGVADRRFAEIASAGAMHYQAPTSERLTSFEEARPFGDENSELWLTTQFAPSGALNRRRFAHSLAVADPKLLIDGGWLAVMGQEDAVRPLFQAFRQLPNRPFHETPSADGGAAPVVLRTLTVDGQTWAYVVNDSPHPVELWAQFQTASERPVTSLDGRPLPPIRSTAPWQVQLEAYDFLAMRFEARGAQLREWRVQSSPEAQSGMERAMAELRLRAGMLQSPPPWNVLSNPGFESESSTGEIQGWLRAAGENIEIATTKNEKYVGQQSLMLKNRSSSSAAWVRSEPFDPPPTGRIAVLVRLKGGSRRQPNLRLAVEGRFRGEVYYRYATVGAGRESPPLKGEWAQYILPIDDLPANGLSELRIGFDLMGPGQVYIDDVQVYQLWFLDDERRELLKSIALADFQRGKGRLAECQRFVESYWPQFLFEHVALPTRPSENAGLAAASPDSQDSKPAESKRRAVLESIHRMRKKMLRF